MTPTPRRTSTACTRSAGAPCFGMSTSRVELPDGLAHPAEHGQRGWLERQRRGHGHRPGLLMAHRQWGSSGAINYYQQAINTINAMKAADFATNGVMIARNVSRTSDYMPGHFRAFKAATNDTFWDDARTNSLALAQTVTTNYSPTPSCSRGSFTTRWAPIRARTRSSRTGPLGHRGDLRPNSVRNPWRWATDYVYSGDTAGEGLPRHRHDDADIQRWQRQRGSRGPTTWMARRTRQWPVPRGHDCRLRDGWRMVDSASRRS
jgi:hypothetical protein